MEVSAYNETFNLPVAADSRLGRLLALLEDMMETAGRELNRLRSVVQPHQAAFKQDLLQMQQVFHGRPFVMVVARNEHLLGLLLQARHHRAQAAEFGRGIGIIVAGIAPLAGKPVLVIPPVQPQVSRFPGGDQRV